MLSDLCGHFKPCGKDLEVLKTSQHDVMDWFVNHVRLLDLMSARTETLHTSLLFIVTVGGGGKRCEGECYLISLNITLHRVQLHHKKSRRETS